MKKCVFCGATLEEDALFCSYCGRKIEKQTCPHCGAELEDDSVFCSECGMRLQTMSDESLSHKTGTKENGTTPKRDYSLLYAIGGIVVGLLILAVPAYYVIVGIHGNEVSTSDTNIVELSLAGDADGFPLKLDLNIDNGNVIGIYKNVNYGTTMTVSGTKVDDMIYLRGVADNTNYIFKINTEGENYTGTFGKVGGKRMQLHLKISPTVDSLLINDEMKRENNDPIKKGKEKIWLAFMNACDDVRDTVAQYVDPILSEYIGDEIELIEYFVYDITGNGIPELWIKSGTCQADLEIKVCTYDKDCSYKTIWESTAGQCSYYEGKGYVLQVYGHMGEAFWTKLTYDGREMVETRIYEEDVNEIDDDGYHYYRDYKKPTEKYIEFHSLQDVEPINRALGLE